MKNKRETYYETIGVNRDKLLKLSKEKLVDMLIKADEYTNNQEGFNILDTKYFIRKKHTRAIKHGGGGITMDVLDAAIKEVYTSEFFKERNPLLDKLTILK